MRSRIVQIILVLLLLKFEPTYPDAIQPRGFSSSATTTATG